MAGGDDTTDYDGGGNDDEQQQLSGGETTSVVCRSTSSRGVKCRRVLSYICSWMGTVCRLL